MAAAGERGRIVRNAIGSYGSRGLMVISALVMTPYLYRRLGADGFGTFSVMLTLTTVLSLVQFGFAAGPTKLIAEYRAQGRRERVQETVGAATSIFLVLGVVALGLSVGAAYALDGLAAASARDDFRLGMIVLGLSMLVRFPCTAYMAALEGYQRYDVSNAAAAVTIVVASVGAVVAVEAGTGVLGVAVAQAVALVASALTGAILLRWVDRELSLRPRLGAPDSRWSLVRFSSFALLADSMIFIGQRMDVIVIAALRNAATAAPYAAVVRLQSGVQSLVLPFVELLMPMMSDLWARGERAEVARRLVAATRIAVQVTLPVAAAVALFARDIVDLWLGRAVPESTVAIVVVLMGAQVLLLAFAPAERVLIGVGSVRAVSALACVEGGANLALSIALVSEYGAIGAALGTLLTSALVSPLKVPLACRVIGLPLAQLVRDGVVRPIVSSLPALVAMIGIALLLPAGPLRLVLGAGIGLGAAAVVAARQIGWNRLRNREASPLDPLDPGAPVESLRR